MATKAAIKRLTKEAQLMEKDPPPFVYARPREDNILEWHYILRGPPDTPYEGGEYHGQLLFPPEFPFKPPGIKMTTPSGRFKPDTKICTTMSDYHPHTWQPGWNTSTILMGLLSFMCSDEMTTGSVTASDSDRRALAARSHEFNMTQKKFCQIFPEYAGKQMRHLPNMGDKNAFDKAASKLPQIASSQPLPPSSDNISNQLRNRGLANTTAANSASITSNPSAPDAAAGSHHNQHTNSNNVAGPQPNNGAGPGGHAPRRDFFGLRSSIVVLVLLAYLFFSRVINATNDGAA